MTFCSIEEAKRQQFKGTTSTGAPRQETPQKVARRGKELWAAVDREAGELIMAAEAREGGPIALVRWGRIHQAGGIFLMRRHEKRPERPYIHLTPRCSPSQLALTVASSSTAREPP